MTKAELIERIARSKSLPPDLTKKDVALVLGLAFEELATYFAKGKVTKANAPRFTFPRFGTFTKKKRSARMGVNPRTLEPMQIEAFHTLDFKASRELRDAMNPESVKASSVVAVKSTAKAGAKGGSEAKAKPRKTRPPKLAKVAADLGDTPLGRRRLTPRDEDAELDAMIDDEGLFEEGPALPSGPLQRVRPRKDGGGEITGARARTG